jgi:hypothetical protein
MSLGPCARSSLAALFILAWQSFAAGYPALAQTSGPATEQIHALLASIRELQSKLEVTSGRQDRGAQFDVRVSLSQLDKQVVDKLDQLSDTEKTEVAIDIATSRLKSGYADPYPIVRDFDLLNKRSVSVAQLLLDLDLPWRALKSLEGLSSPDADELRQTVLQILSILDEEYREAGVQSSSQVSLPSRLRHLLSIPPAMAGTYRKLATFASQSDDSTDGQDGSDRVLAPPFNRTLPNVIRNATRNSTQGTPDSIANGRPAGLYSGDADQLAVLELRSPETASLLARLLTNSQARTDARQLGDAGISADAEVIVRSILTSDLSANIASTANEALQPFKEDILTPELLAQAGLETSFVIKSGLVVQLHVELPKSQFLSTPWTLLMHLTANEDKIKVSFTAGQGDFRIEFLNQGVDRSPQIVMTSNTGSGQFLIGQLVDFEKARTGELPRVGYGFAAPIDADGSQNGVLLLLSKRSEGKFFFCTRCPAPLSMTAYGVERDTGRLVMLGERVTLTDHGLGLAAGIFGMTAGMQRQVYGSNLDKRFERLRSQRRSGLVHRSRDYLLRSILAALDSLDKSRNFSVVSFYEKQLLQIIGVRADSVSRSRLIAGITLKLIQHQLMLGNSADAYQTLHAMPLSPAQLDQIGSAEQYRNTAAIVALSHHRFNEAYDIFQQQRSAGRMRSADLGNYSYFLEQVGDKRSQKVACNDALDAALRENDLSGVELDMVYCARAALAAGENEEALDWLSRAFRSLRETSSNATLTHALMLCGDLSIRERQALTASMCFEEAFYLMGSLSWQMEGSDLLLGYAAALDLEQQSAEALDLVNAAVSLSRHLRGRSYAAALAAKAARLSSPSDRVSLLTEAMAVLSESKGDVPRENFKLTFLATAEEIESEYLASLAATSTPPEVILKRSEEWKSQVLQEFRRGAASGLRDSDLLPAIRAKLPANGVFVSYSIGTKFAGAIVVDHTSIRLVPVSVTPQEANSLVSQLRKELDIQNPSVLSAIRERRGNYIPSSLAEKLREAFRILIEPLDLSGDTGLLLISPDGPLAGMPWTAVSKPPTFLDKVYSKINGTEILRPIGAEMVVLITPSASLFGRPTLRKEIANVLLVSASKAVPRVVILNEFPEAKRLNSDLALPELKSAGAEVCASAQALREIATDLAVYSSDANWKCPAFTKPSSAGWPDISLFAGKQIVHLAAHGMFNPNIPMASFIVADPESNRVVRASDISAIDLSQAELVVLSACQTGRIEVETGFEALGFARALFSAGAKRSLLADWSIDDDSTSIFFGKLYSEVGRGVSIEKAFQSAIIYLSGRVRHPYLWAAFELYVT